MRKPILWLRAQRVLLSFPEGIKQSVGSPPKEKGKSNSAAERLRKEREPYIFTSRSMRTYLSLHIGTLILRVKAANCERQGVQLMLNERQVSTRYQLGQTLNRSQ